MHNACCLEGATGLTKLKLYVMCGYRDRGNSREMTLILNNSSRIYQVNYIYVYT